MPFPLDEIYIQQAESMLNVAFPPDFRSKMLQDNGGEIETEEDHWKIFPFRDASDKKRLSRTSNDIVRETEMAKKWPAFPADCIAIAANGSGDFLVFKREAPSSRSLENAVYCWLHETGELQKAAPSFSELK